MLSSPGFVGISSSEAASGLAFRRPVVEGGHSIGGLAMILVRRRSVLSVSRALLLLCVEVDE